MSCTHDASADGSASVIWLEGGWVWAGTGGGGWGDGSGERQGLITYNWPDVLISEPLATLADTRVRYR